MTTRSPFASLHCTEVDTQTDLNNSRSHDEMAPSKTLLIAACLLACASMVSVRGRFDAMVLC